MPIQILMPALSPTMTEGNLVKWHKKEGDRIEIGDILAEIETDKATMEVESVEEGVLAKIFVSEGTEDVAVNTLIAALLEEGEDASTLAGMGSSSVESSVATPKAAATPTPTPAPVSAPAPAPLATAATIPITPTTTKPANANQGRIFATPLAKRIANQNNIDLSAIQGSGPHGRIIKADVENTPTGMPAKAPTRAPLGDIIPADDLFPAYEHVKLNNMRKVIAKRLTESKQTVPHFYLTVDCQLDALMAARATLNEDLDQTQRLSVNDFILKAMAKALLNVPEANASFAGDHLKIYQNVDISVAVAIEGGLVTPIIKAAETKSVFQISKEMKDLASRARAGKLKPEEFQGGTISLSNLGMYGISNFSAVINPPQGCILAVGAGEKKPIVTESGDLEVATIMTCTLSVDHRVVDGAVGSLFLKHFKDCLQNPIKLMI